MDINKLNDEDKENAHLIATIIIKGGGQKEVEEIIKDFANKKEIFLASCDLLLGDGYGIDDYEDDFDDYDYY